MTELHQRSRVETPNGDAAPPRFFHNRGGGRTQAYALVKLLQLPDERMHVVRLAAHAGLNQRRAFAHALQSDFLFLIGDDHPPDAFVA